MKQKLKQNNEKQPKGIQIGNDSTAYKDIEDALTACPSISEERREAILNLLIPLDPRPTETDIITMIKRKANNSRILSVKVSSKVAELSRSLKEAGYEISGVIRPSVESAIKKRFREENWRGKNGG